MRNCASRHAARSRPGRRPVRPPRPAAPSRPVRWGYEPHGGRLRSAARPGTSRGPGAGAGAGRAGGGGLGARAARPGGAGARAAGTGSRGSRRRARAGGAGLPYGGGARGAGDSPAPARLGSCLSGCNLRATKFTSLWNPAGGVQAASAAAPPLPGPRGRPGPPRGSDRRFRDRAGAGGPPACPPPGGTAPAPCAPGPGSRAPAAAPPRGDWRAPRRWVPVSLQGGRGAGSEAAGGSAGQGPGRAGWRCARVVVGVGTSPAASGRGGRCAGPGAGEASSPLEPAGHHGLPARRTPPRAGPARPGRRQGQGQGRTGTRKQAGWEAAAGSQFLGGREEAGGSVRPRPQGNTAVSAQPPVLPALAAGRAETLLRLQGGCLRPVLAASFWGLFSGALIPSCPPPPEPDHLPAPHLLTPSLWG